MSLYKERDIEGQGKTYTNHILAMTHEGLWTKSDIAAELAHRDIILEELLEVLEHIKQSWSLDEVYEIAQEAIKRVEHERLLQEDKSV